MPPREKSEDDLDRFISIAEANRRLGISAHTARKWIVDRVYPVPV